jgi:hypothetical protein
MYGGIKNGTSNTASQMRAWDGASCRRKIANGNAMIVDTNVTQVAKVNEFNVACTNAGFCKLGKKIEKGAANEPSFNCGKIANATMANTGKPTKTTSKPVANIDKAGDNHRPEALFGTRASNNVIARSI